MNASATRLAAQVKPAIRRESRCMDLSELVERHQAEIWRYLRYLGAQAAEADDLVQETFLAVARSSFEQRSPQETTGYLRTTARNQFLSLRRKQKREVLTARVEAAEAVWVEHAAGDLWNGQVSAIRDCVEKLEGRARHAIDLHYREKTSRTTIAERLGMKPDGVKTLLRRTRALLRECVERALGQSR